jgi:hypothetical protein
MSAPHLSRTRSVRGRRGSAVMALPAPRMNIARNTCPKPALRNELPKLCGTRNLRGSRWRQPRAMRHAASKRSVELARRVGPAGGPYGRSGAGRRPRVRPPTSTVMGTRGGVGIESQALHLAAGPGPIRIGRRAVGERVPPGRADHGVRDPVGMRHRVAVANCAPPEAEDPELPAAPGQAADFRGMESGAWSDRGPRPFRPMRW